MTVSQGSEGPASPVVDVLDEAAPETVHSAVPEPHDDVLPPSGRHRLPVVGLGGSAGGIRALREFFDHAPVAAGIAYVVVLHLSPDHESTLPQLLQKHTAMPVRVARDADRLGPDRVYVIPAGRHLTVVDGHLRLEPFRNEPGQRAAVDLFFRSLAQGHGPHAVAAVLSGVDGDGAMGLKRIKERGGLTIAQDPLEAEYPGMPSSAIATGMVDWVLTSAAMPGRIVAYLESERRLRLPPEDGPTPGASSAPAPAAAPAAAPTAPPSPSETGLRAVLAFLRSQTGHDFSCYKRATIVRRLGRRLQICGVYDLGAYLDHLRTHPGEIRALLQDLLISVTNFFRDPEAFDALEAQIPALFRAKRAGDTVRVWCPACATGEEAYTLAMLLLEHARTLESAPKLQVFGCDLDEPAIQVARAGFYPDTIAADVAEDRLLRYFTKEPGGWRVRRQLRETVLFAGHDLLKDAPFSRMDLVSCRNLLVYLNREAQARALDILHFALDPGGLLFLGPAESVEASSALFEPIDAAHRLYRQRRVRRVGVPPVASGDRDEALRRAIRHHERLKYRPTALAGPNLAATFGAPPGHLPSSAGEGGGEAADALHAALLARFGPASILVNAALEVVHLSRTANRFLQMPEGEPTQDLLRLVPAGLREALRDALARAAETRRPVAVSVPAFDLPDGQQVTSLQVAPAGELAPGSLLVLLESRDPPAGADPVAGAAAVERRSSESAAAVNRFERRLTLADARLRATVERHALATEEFRAGTEELQAMNEELHSAGEKLQTSREELQSLNEELVTVNAEFRHRVEELGRANSDLHNLMSATRIATVFLDRELQVMRFTPPAAPLFNLIASDVGRPIAHLNRRLDYPQLQEDAEQVLRTLVPIERELREDGHWYLARALPYRTLDDQIAGVVLTFVDITDRREAEQALRDSELALRKSEERFRLLVTAVSPIVYTMSPDWREMRSLVGKGFLADVRRPSPTWFEQYIPETDRVAVRAAIAHAIRTRSPFELEHRVMDTDGGVGWTFSQAIPFLDEHGEIVEWFGAASDISERKRADERRAFLLTLADQLRSLTDPLDMMAAAAEALGRHLLVGRCAYGEVDATGEVYAVERDWSDGVLASATGRHRCSDFGAEYLAACRTGTSVSIDDALVDARTRGHEAAFEPIGSVQASLTVPLLKGGRWVASVCVQQGRPRHWRPDDELLLREVAERTWAAVERARSESALRTSEARLQLALDAADMGTFVWYPREDRSESDGRNLALFGLSSGDALSFLHSSDRIPPEDRAAHLDAVRRALDPAGDGMLRSEHRIRRASDGAERWIMTVGRTRFAGDPPAAVSVSGVCIDVTDAHRIEASLRESETRLRLALEASELATWEWHLDTNLLLWNEQHFVLFGLQPHGNPVRPEEFFRHIHADDRDRVIGQLQASIDTKRIFATEFRAIREDGESRWMSGYGRVVAEAADGRPTKLSGMLMDITARKTAEEALQASVERFRTLADAVPQIIWSNDGEGSADYFNRRWYDYAGLSAVASYGPGWQAIVHPDDDLAASSEWRRVQSTGEVFESEYRLRGADGRYRWFIGRNVPVRDAEGRVTGWFGTATDIDDLKGAEAALERSRRELQSALADTVAARDEAQAAGKAKDRFLAILSHELRTPLTPALLAVQVLARNRALPTSAGNALGVIERNVRLEIHLVDDLLDVTRIATGKLELRRTRTSLLQMIGLAVEVSRPDIEARSQRLVVELGTGPDVLDVDPKRLQQVFWNLLKNASKFTPQGGTITIRSRGEADRVVVEVSDTGIGFDTAAAERLFGAFEQENASVTREFGGLGLGLAIARASVEAHDGRIRAASDGPGRGATFTVELPFAGPDPAIPSIRPSLP